MLLSEMSSSKGLRLLPFVHDLEVSKPVDIDILYVRALCWASYKKCVKYKVRMIINSLGKPKITSVLCVIQHVLLIGVAAAAM